MSLLLDQPFLVAPFAAYVVAQVGKFGLKDFHGERDIPYLYRSGGMPSAHSAVVMALAATVGAADGFSSTTFGIALWLAAIVIYDSINVRRVTGEQTVAIKQLQAHTKLDTKERWHHMHDAKGHTPKQALVGGVLGGVIGLCFTPHLWGVRAAWLVNSLNAVELRAMHVVYLSLLILSLSFYLALTRTTEASIKMKKAVSYGLLTPIGAGLLLTWLGMASVLESIMRFYTLLPLFAAAFLTFLAASHITIERVRVRPANTSKK